MTQRIITLLLSIFLLIGLEAESSALSYPSPTIHIATQSTAPTPIEVYSKVAYVKSLGGEPSPGEEISPEQILGIAKGTLMPPESRVTNDTYDFELRILGRQCANPPPKYPPCRTS
jgi:hypothetical protein